LIQEGAATPIPMTSNVYIGLALTSHEVALTCEAVFSNVTTTGTVSGQWANQDIGISSNAAEPLYVAVSNTAGTPAVVIHDNPSASTTDTWTEWIIPLQALADQGINLTRPVVQVRCSLTISAFTNRERLPPSNSSCFGNNVRICICMEPMPIHSV